MGLFGTKKKKNLEQMVKGVIDDNGIKTTISIPDCNCYHSERIPVFAELPEKREEAIARFKERLFVNKNKDYGEIAFVSPLEYEHHEIHGKQSERVVLIVYRPILASTDTS